MKENKTMRVIIFDEFGGPEVLKLGKFEMPIPAGKEVLVKVEATALNRADTLQRMGKYPPPDGASPILGLEIAGIVYEIGSEVKKWKPGDRVFGLIPGGGYAEYAVINEDMVMPVPENLSTIEAAAIPEVFLTAFQALAWYGKLKAGESILIHAGGSGVGTAAIQLAKETKADVFVTASRTKHNICLELGAEKTIDYRTEEFDKKIFEFTNDQGVDVIIDFIAGTYFKKNIDLLRTDGRLIILATLGGGSTEKIDLRKILYKRLTVIGSTLRSRSLEYQINLTKDFKEKMLPKFSTGKIKPIIDSIYDWKDVSNAHRYMEENKNTGKIVLKVS